MASPKSKKKKCILCGNTIIKPSSSDEYVCRDCEKENVEARYLNNWAI